MRTALSFCFLLSTLPLGDLLLQPLEHAFPAKPEINDPKAIIILGGWEDLVFLGDRTKILHTTMILGW